MSPRGRQDPLCERRERRDITAACWPWLDSDTAGAHRRANQGGFTAVFRRVSPMTTAENHCAGTWVKESRRFGGYEAQTIFWRPTLVACSAPGQATSARLIGDGMSGRGREEYPRALSNPCGAPLRLQPGLLTGGITRSEVQEQPTRKPTFLRLWGTHRVRHGHPEAARASVERLRGHQRIRSHSADAEVKIAPPGLLSSVGPHTPAGKRDPGLSADS